MEALGYRININGENDSFAGGEFHAEMARILRKLADDIERGKVYETRRRGMTLFFEKNPKLTIIFIDKFSEIR